MFGTPKAPRETAEQKATRLAEEARIKAMQARADAEDAAAGRLLLTRRTRQVIRLFGARRAMIGGLGGSIGGGFGSAGGSISGGGSSASFPLGYSGGGGSGGTGGGVKSGISRGGIVF